MQMTSSIRKPHYRILSPVHFQNALRAELFSFSNIIILAKRTSKGYQGKNHQFRMLPWWGFNGFWWVSMGFDGFLMGFNGFQWVLMGFDGFLMGFNGFWWVSMGFDGFLMGFNGFWWVSMGFDGFLMGFDGFVHNGLLRNAFWTLPNPREISPLKQKLHRTSHQ